MTLLSENPVRRKYSRHIDIRYYFVRDLVAQKVMKLPLGFPCAHIMITHRMVGDELKK